MRASSQDNLRHCSAEAKENCIRSPNSGDLFTLQQLRSSIWYKENGPLPQVEEAVKATLEDIEGVNAAFLSISRRLQNMADRPRGLRGLGLPSLMHRLDMLLLEIQNLPGAEELTFSNVNDCLRCELSYKNPLVRTEASERFRSRFGRFLSRILRSGLPGDMSRSPCHPRGRN